MDYRLLVTDTLKHAQSGGVSSEDFGLSEWSQCDLHTFSVSFPQVTAALEARL